jgi:hypothetical protein
VARQTDLRLAFPSRKWFLGDHSMCFLRSGFCAVLLLVLAAGLLGQSAQNAPTTPPGQSSPQAPPAQASPQAPAGSEQTRPTPPAARNGRPLRQVPCWREAGISPAMMNQRWQIEDNAKGKIAGVCSDHSLTPEKKGDKIRQIDQDTAREIAKIIPAKQLEAFKACQAERDREKANRPGKTPPRELGPCGGVIPKQPDASPHSHEHQPSNPSTSDPKSTVPAPQKP